jgi:hypothetical protein
MLLSLSDLFVAVTVDGGDGDTATPVGNGERMSDTNRPLYPTIKIRPIRCQSLIIARSCFSDACSGRVRKKILL